MPNELQFRVVLGLLLPFIAFSHAIWANQPALFLISFTIGLVWAIYRELFWAKTCVDATLLYPAEMGLVLFVSYSVLILVRLN